MKDYYKILGISYKASTAAIQTAYESKSKDPAKKWDEDFLKECEEAHAVLSDPERRNQYIRLFNKVTNLKIKINSLEQQLTTSDEHKKIISNLKALHGELAERRSRLTHEEDSVILDETLNLIDSLQKNANIENCKHSLFEYGKKIRQAFLQTEVNRFEKLPLKFLNELLVNNLGYGIVELELFELDQQIDRVKRLEKDTVYKNKFIHSLINQKNKIKNDIQSQCQHQKNWAWENYRIHSTILEIMNSVGFTSLIDTVQTLKELQYTDESKTEDKLILLQLAEQYKQKAKEVPHVKNFLKSVLTTVVSALSCILTIPLGIVAFLFAGPECFVLPGQVAIYGYDASRKLTGLPANVPLSQHLLFRNLASDAVKTAEMARNFIDPSEAEKLENEGIYSPALSEYTLLKI